MTGLAAIGFFFFYIIHFLGYIRICGELLQKEAKIKLQYYEAKILNNAAHFVQNL